MIDPGDIATRQETCIVRDGLTCEFRDSVKYQSWRADILQKIPGASDFFIDTAIYWYLSRPDMFETEDGKRWIADMEARKRRPHSIKEEEDVDGPNLPDSGHGDICDDAGVRGSASTSGAADSATAAADFDSNTASSSTCVENTLSIDEAQVDR
jgi:hypothetical protein